MKIDFGRIRQIRKKHTFCELYEIILGRIFSVVPEIISYICNKILFGIKRVRVGKNFSSRGLILVKNGNRIPFTGPINIIIGTNVRINSSRNSNAMGGDHKTILRTITTSGKIEIGDNTGISNTAIVAQEFIKIGRNVKIGAGCKIYDNDFHSLEVNERINNTGKIQCASIFIEDDVFIGAHSIILKGVTIGKGAVIGAGAVVTKSVAQNEIWAGNPARFIRKIT